MENSKGRRMREYRPGNPLVFNHIPKCAGTSLGTALMQVLQPAVVVQGVDTSLVGGYADFDHLRGNVRSRIFLDPGDLAADATLVYGHISPGTTMVRYPGADHITAVRNPRLRVMSQWVHSRFLSDFDLRHWGAVAPAFRIGRRPLAQYLDHEMIAPNVDNTITRFLAWPHPLLEPTRFIDENHDDELMAAALDRLASFAFVGLVEKRDFLGDLSSWLGLELPDTRLNERQWIPRARRPDLESELSAGTIGLLDHRTRLDQQIWSRVVRSMLPDEDPAQLLRTTWERSLDRYEAAFDAPREFRPVKRMTEFMYESATRIRSVRRHD